MASSLSKKAILPYPSVRNFSSLQRDGVGYLDSAWGGINQVRSQPQQFQFDTVRSGNVIPNNPDHTITKPPQENSATILPSIEENLSDILERDMVHKPGFFPSSDEWSSRSEDSGPRRPEHTGSAARGPLAQHLLLNATSSDEETRSFSTQNGALAGARDEEDEADYSPIPYPGTAGHISHWLGTSSHGPPSPPPAAAPTFAQSRQTHKTVRRKSERTVPAPGSPMATVLPAQSLTAAGSSHAPQQGQKAKPHIKTEIENKLARKIDDLGQIAANPCKRCQRMGTQCMVYPRQSTRCSTCVRAKDKCEFP
jgi:hypothetical protein